MQASQPNWFAVVTKPRQEQIALENLQRQDFECFLPMAENPYQRRRKQRRRMIEPLFPRYLFIRAVPEVQDLAPVRSTRGVNTMVRFGTKLATVPKAIIHQLKSRRCAKTGLIRIKAVAIKAGDKVRIFDGPLAGITGIVQEQNSENRVLILMELLGRPTQVEVDALMLQRFG